MPGPGPPLCQSSAIILVIGSSINYAPSSWCGLLFLFLTGSLLPPFNKWKKYLSLQFHLSNDSLHLHPSLLLQPMQMHPPETRVCAQQQLLSSKKRQLKNKENRVDVKCLPPSSSPSINNSHTWTFELIMGHRWPIWCRSCQMSAARTFLSPD